MKQTAVEWLVEQLKERGYAGEFPPHLLFEQSKEMEKEQIINAWIATDNELQRISAEKYYNETYGGKNE
jgi:pyruvate/2-oxoglutarate dehydrogenase complex dihydrolipoamide acyltransferase (E2) component